MGISDRGFNASRQICTPLRSHVNKSRSDGIDIAVGVSPRNAAPSNPGVARATGHLGFGSCDFGLGMWDFGSVVHAHQSICKSGRGALRPLLALRSATRFSNRLLSADWLEHSPSQAGAERLFLTCKRVFDLYLGCGRWGLTESITPDGVTHTEWVNPATPNSGLVSITPDGVTHTESARLMISV